MRAEPILAPLQPWQIDACRAREGRCPNALAGLSDLLNQLERAVRDSGWEAHIRRHTPARVLPHQRLRVALAACPNACTQPQIKDIGLIAEIRPTRVRPACTACGACEDACRERAIAVVDGRAALCLDACVGCGQCMRSCAVSAIDSEGLCFRVMFGGRVGRHPRWATELPWTVPPADAPAVVARVLEAVVGEIGPHQRLADLIERWGPQRLYDIAGGSRGV